MRAFWGVMPRVVTILLVLLALATPCSGASFIGVPWGMAKAGESGKKIDHADALGEVRDTLSKGFGSLTSVVRERFAAHRQKAEERWRLRQAALAEVSASQSGRVQEVLQRAGEAVVADKGTEEAAIQQLEEAVRARESDYEGYTAEQVEFMKSHYATIRPSPTLLRKPKAADPPPPPTFVRSETDDLEEHILAPTHEDEVEIAKRRESFRISTRLRHHKMEKSHTH